MFEWDSQLYLHFEKERNLAAIDLILQIKHIIASEKVTHILDLGCGPGNSAALLRQYFNSSYILGIDSSPNMIEEARKRKLPACDFKLCDANIELESLDKKFDIIFANASLHWLACQEKVIADCFALLKNDGVLAVQIPIDSLSLFHQILQILSQNNKWKNCFKSKRVFSSLNAEEYVSLLQDHTFSFRVWESHYYHLLPNVQAIIEWYKGSGLRAYLNQLDKNMQAEFETDIYNELCLHEAIKNKQGVILKVPRLFFIAQKKDSII